MVLWNGLGVFWPSAIHLVTLRDGTQLLGEIVERDTTKVRLFDEETEADREAGRFKFRPVERWKIKVGNRENGPAFQWVDCEIREDAQPDGNGASGTHEWVSNIAEITEPDDAYKLDRMTDLNYFGFLKEIQAPELPSIPAGPLPQRLSAALAAAKRVEKAEIQPIQSDESVIERELTSVIAPEKVALNYEKKQLIKRSRSSEGSFGSTEFSSRIAEIDRQLAAFVQREDQLKEESHALAGRRGKAEAALRTNVAVFVDSHGREQSIPLIGIVRFTRPNSMGLGAKAGHYGAKIWEMLSDDPREANQDGGLFPAIFGTVLLVFLMSITCFPLGVLAGIYLGEYAKQGPLVRLVRVAVNNLAGIPSIVYGIFGLGFFIYLCGGALDGWLFPAWVDAGKPVFGQGCIFWASLTLGLLTIPVVIVSTEEALMAIPRDVRESSYALGSTKFQTLVRILVPMASPGMMTGFILAMARAAGEVAPLMITGAVKSAPVPIQETLPFIRLDRQFMHLGFHIFDISCKSPNVEATKPMVYVTTLLLLAIVLTMTSVAIWLRNRMRKRFELRTI